MSNVTLCTVPAGCGLGFGAFGSRAWKPSGAPAPKSNPGAAAVAVADVAATTRVPLLRSTRKPRLSMLTINEMTTNEAMAVGHALAPPD